MTEKETKKAKRLSEFQFWIQEFGNFYQEEKKSSIVFIDNAAEILNDVYWTMIENYVRPLVDSMDEHNGDDDESLLSRFKAISATELTIVHIQPICDDNESQERRLNAIFAYTVALQILQSVNPEISQKAIAFVDGFKEEIDTIDPSAILTIQEDHIIWLELLDAKLATPILSNAQTWRLFNLALLSLDNKLNYNV